MKRGSARRARYRPAEHTPKRQCLADLLARMPTDYVPAEENWGKPVGKEAWWVRAKSEHGEREIRAGKGISHEAAKRRIRRRVR